MVVPPQPLLPIDPSPEDIIDPIPPPPEEEPCTDDPPEIPTPSED